MSNENGATNDTGTLDTKSDASVDFGMGDFFGTVSAKAVEEPATTPTDGGNLSTENLSQGGLSGETVTSKNDGTLSNSAGVSTGEEKTSTQGEEDTPEQDLVALRSQLEQAVGQMGIMATQLQQFQSSQPKVEMALPDNPKELSTVDFLQGQTPADFLETPEALNTLLNKVATISARAGQQAGYEMAMRSIPQVVQNSAQQQYNLQAAADNFYKQNADLTPFKKAVGMAAMDFYSKNPQATLEQIMEGAGKATRQILRLRGTTAGRVPAQPAATVGAGGQDRLAQPPQLTSMEQQIFDVINAAQ